MKELVWPGQGLQGLRWSTRFIYTVFLLFCAAGYGVMAALAVERSGLSTAEIASYYLGDEATMKFGKTYGELLEVTHFHLFSMPLLLFVQGHLFLLTRWPRPVKVALVLAGALGIACDLAAPWLIVYGGPQWAFTKTAARLLMGIAFLAFAAVPLWEMWLAGGNGLGRSPQPGSPQ